MRWLITMNKNLQIQEQENVIHFITNNFDDMETKKQQETVEKEVQTSECIAKVTEETPGVVVEDMNMNMDMDMEKTAGLIQVKDEDEEDVMIPLEDMVVEYKKDDVVIKHVALTANHIKKGYEIFIDKPIKDITAEDVNTLVKAYKEQGIQKIVVQTNGSTTVMLWLISACYKEGMFLECITYSRVCQEERVIEYNFTIK